MADPSESPPPAANPGFDPAAVADGAREHGLVALVGAGASMGPPSALPGWTAMNNAFIEMLAHTVALHTDGEVGYDVAELVAARRDEAAVAAPDLQAQLAEESFGEAYFGLFAPLDIDAWNESHAAIAAIARSGVLRAVISTNFDRLIELACTAAGVEHAVFCAPADFERLAERVPDGALPIVKVHGSVDRPDTMVDTLRQRIIGRPAALDTALAGLFARHAVLVVGFSGADLAYDPHYLGLRAGAGASPAFTFVNRAGAAPREEISALAAASPRMRIVDGDLPGSLVALADALGQDGPLVAPRWDTEMEFPGMRIATLSSRVARAAEDAISPVQATVVLAAIAEAAGGSDAAFHLLTRTMPHHSRAGLLGDPAMTRQQRMIAAELVEMARLHPELSPEPGLTALGVLSIREVRPDTEGLAIQALAFALCGDGVASDAAGLQALRESREEFVPARRADTICSLARAWTVFERWVAPHRIALSQEYERMYNHGDEPRRIRVGALYGRFLLEAGELEAAERVVIDCQAASRLLKLPHLHNDLVALGGRLHLALGHGEEAARVLSSVYGHHERNGQLLRCAETLLPLGEAALAAGDGELLARSRSVFDRLVPIMPGLALPYAASQVRMCLALGAVDDARAVVGDLEALGKRWATNVWAGALAAELSGRIDAAAT
jgi:SIR2-like protein